MITWPAVIKFEGDDELSFVASQMAWESEEKTSRVHYDLADQLIDSHGKIYQMHVAANGSVVLKDTGNTLALSAMTGLVRKHASQLGNCCVSKIHFDSFSEAVATVETLIEV